MSGISEEKMAQYKEEFALFDKDGKALFSVVLRLLLLFLMMVFTWYTVTVFFVNTTVCIYECVYMTVYI